MSLHTNAVIRRGNQVTHDCPICGSEMGRVNDDRGRIKGWQCLSDTCAHREEV